MHSPSPLSTMGDYQIEVHFGLVSMLAVAQELHQRYYEPLARIASSLDEIVQGPPLKKLLFMTDPAVIDTQLKPLWQARLIPPSPTFIMR